MPDFIHAALGFVGLGLLVLFGVLVILGIIAQMLDHARSHSERQRAEQELRRAILEGRLEVSIRAEPDASDAAPDTGTGNQRGSGS